MMHIYKVKVGLTVVAMVVFVYPCAALGQQNSDVASLAAAGHPAVANSNHKSKINFAGTISSNNQKTERVLDGVWKADYFEQRFGDVVEEWQADHQVPIEIHETARENNLDEDTLITMTMVARASTMLDTLLENYSCSYVVRDGIIVILDKSKALEPEFLPLRTFDCRAIIDRQFSGDVDQLVEMLKDLIDPRSWEENGGVGRVREVNGRLFITQSTFNMRQIKRIIDELQLLANQP